MVCDTYATIFHMQDVILGLTAKRNFVEKLLFLANMYQPEIVIISNHHIVIIQHPLSLSSETVSKLKELYTTTSPFI